MTANPTYLTNANSPAQQVDTLFDASGNPFYKLAGPGAKSYSGFTEPLVPAAVSTHGNGYGILPTDGLVSASGQALVSTTLAAAITSVGATSISVSSAVGFPPDPPAGSAIPAQFRITIDSEDMLVTGGNGTTTWTVTRGYNGTTPATHLVSATVVGYIAIPLATDPSGHIQTVEGAVTDGIGSWEALRTPKVFKPLSAVVITTETTIWTPASGKKFRLMGFVITQGVATGDVTLKDNTGGTTILVIPATPTGQPLPFGMGNGILSAAVNNVLTATGASTETISGFVYGTEE